MLRRVALAKNHVSEELSVSIIRVTRTGELATSVLVTLMMEALRSAKRLFYKSHTA
jgi:hypothetical protein